MLQWRNPAIELDAVDNEYYRHLLTGATACGFEEFRQQVIKQVAAIRAENDAPPPSISPICVRAHKHDIDLSGQVTQILLDLGESS